MKKNISSFEKIIGVKFKNQNLLLQSLTHKSNNPLNNNEKLEFLGELLEINKKTNIKTFLIGESLLRNLDKNSIYSIL